VTVTIHFHLELLALVYVLASGYCAALAWWASDQLGSGPKYTTRDHVAGFVSILSLFAFVACIASAIAVVVGRSA
jgi:hypothetical protein